MMNQFEKIQQSISIQNSQPQSIKFIKDLHNGTAFQTSSISEQSQKLSNHSVIVVNSALNNLQVDLFNGVEENKIIDFLNIMDSDLPDSSERQNSGQNNLGQVRTNAKKNEVLQTTESSQTEKNKTKLLKNENKNKIKIPAFQEIEPIGKYISLDDSASYISSQELHQQDEQIQQFFSKTEPASNPFHRKPQNQSFQNNFNSAKPSYLKIMESLSPKKFSIFHSNTLTANTNTDNNLSKKYENCRTLLMKQIQKNKQLQEKLTDTNKENQELRNLICEIMGKQINRIDVENRSAKKKMNRLTTQQTQKMSSKQQFAPQITSSQLQNSLKMTKFKPLALKKFSEKAIKTQSGCWIKENENRSNKKNSKQALSKKKTVYQLCKKVNKFEMILHQLINKNRFSRSQLSHGKDPQLHALSKGSTACNYGKLNTELSSSHNQIKKQLSKTKKKRIKTEAREKSGL